MTAFAASNGLTNYYENYSGGSVNATVDTYTISADSKLVVRTDTYACVNHSIPFGSLDTVSFSGQGGELIFDPTYVRVIAYTGGSGNAPAFGTTISQGGVSGVFLGAWTTWQTDNILPGAAIGATGFIKVGGVVGGSFAAGALTGIAATASGPDVQGWIEVRGPDTCTVNVQRTGRVSSVPAWFELGVTNGTRGQILACPTTGNVAGIFPGCWIETAPSSGVYDRYVGAGSLVSSTYPTDARGKVIWSTTTGLRIGHDGTNGVGFLPPAGCKVRIPATILTCCTRTTSGSGARVLPNATMGTRQEFVATASGDFVLDTLVCMWYANFGQAYRADILNCAISDQLRLSEIAEPINVDNVIVGVTQAQLAGGGNVFDLISCFAGGAVKNSVFARYNLAAAGVYVGVVQYTKGVLFQDVRTQTHVERATPTTGGWSCTSVDTCTWLRPELIGGRMIFFASNDSEVLDPIYADSLAATSTSNAQCAVEISNGSSNMLVSGGSGFPGVVNCHPYQGWVAVGASRNIKIRNLASPSSPYPGGSANAMEVIFRSNGNNVGVKVQRCYAVSLRTGPYITNNSDVDVQIDNTMGDDADAPALACLNSTVRSCRSVGTTAGQAAVYGMHWATRFLSTTAGVVELFGNEFTAASAAQCLHTGGTPQYDSQGSALLTKVGDQITWEMPYFAKGYTAFNSTAPTLVGNAIAYSSGARWGNHDIHFQVDTGSGYGGTWLDFTGANLALAAISASTGFRLKVRATCAVANGTNRLTNIRVQMLTTAAAQADNLYPLDTFKLSVTGLIPGSDVVVRSAGTSTILASVDSNVGTIWNYEYETPGNIDIDVILPGYIIVPFRNFATTAADSSLPVSQLVDRNYA